MLRQIKHKSICSIHIKVNTSVEANMRHFCPHSALLFIALTLTQF